MAFPVIEGSADYTTATDSTSHTITMPSGIVAGELLLSFLMIDGTATGAGFPGEVTGWERIADCRALASGTGAARLVVFQKIAAGSDTMTVPVSASQMIAARTYRISGVAAADIAFTEGTATSTAPDPPSLTSHWGSGRDTLWITAVGYDDGTRTVSAYPSGWSNTANVRVNNAGGTGLGLATLTSTNATEDPGTFTISAAEEWAGVTVALHDTAPTSPITIVEKLVPADNGTPTWGTLHAANDVAVYFAALSTTADSASLTGWTVIQTAPYTGTSFSNVAWAAYKVLAGNESGSIGTPTVVDGSWDESSVIIFRGVSTTNPIDVTGTATHEYEGRKATPEFISVTTTVDDALVVAFLAMNYNIRPGMGPSWTLGTSRSRPAKSGGENVWYRLQPTAGTVGEQVVVWPDNDAWYSTFMFALRPGVVTIANSAVATPASIPSPTPTTAATPTPGEVPTPVAVLAVTLTLQSTATPAAVATPVAVPSPNVRIAAALQTVPTPVAIPSPTGVVVVQPSTPTGTGTANAPTIIASGATAAQAATATGAAQTARLRVAERPGTVTGTGTAQTTIVRPATITVVATATGAANAPTLVNASRFAAPTATATGTAQPTGKRVALNAGTATATGSVSAPTQVPTPRPSTATATGAAYGAAPQDTLRPPQATATGVAQPRAPAIRPTVPAVTGTGTGYNAVFSASRTATPGVIATPVAVPSPVAKLGAKPFLVEARIPADFATPTWGTLHQNNDVAIYIATFAAATTAVSLSGWTEIGFAENNTGGTSFAVSVWAAYKILDGTETGSVGTPTGTGGSYAHGHVLIFRDVSISDVVDAVGAEIHRYDSDATADVQGITVANDTLVVAVAGFGPNYTLTFNGTGYTTGHQRTTTSRASGENSYYKTRDSGTEAAATWSNDLGTAGWYSSFMFSLNGADTYTARPAVTPVATPVTVPAATPTTAVLTSPATVATPVAVPTAKGVIVARPGTATATGTANNPSVTGNGTITPATVTATGAAQTARLRITRPAPTATATSAAQTAAPAVTRPAPATTGTGTANPPTPTNTSRFAAPTATASGAANPSTFFDGLIPFIAASATSFENNYINSGTINLPAGITTGDLLLIFTTNSATPDLDTPSGWTEIAAANVNSLTYPRNGQIFGRIATGSEGSTVAVSFPAGNFGGWSAVAVRIASANQNLSAIDVSAFQGGGTSPLTVPSLTSNHTNRLALRWIGGSGRSTWTPPSGVTLVAAAATTATANCEDRLYTDDDNSLDQLSFTHSNASVPGNDPNVGSLFGVTVAIGIPAQTTTTPGTATGTGTANPAACAVTERPPTATGAATATPPVFSASRTVAAATATATGTAATPTETITPRPGTVTGTGTAAQPTFLQAGGAAAITATATGTANPATFSASRTITPAAATGTGATEEPGHDIGARQGRGPNLVTNGDASLGNNTNFTSWTYDPAVTYNGLASFRYTSSTYDSVTSTLYIPVDPDKTYDFSAAFKGDTNVRFYAGFREYDADFRFINPEMVRWRAGTNTTLAADLKPGDTTVTLTSAANWQNAGFTHERRIVFYPYTDGTGYTWPAYTYSRNYTAADTWLAGGISGNTITLTTPWAGRFYPAGTAVANALSANTWNYSLAANIFAPADWQVRTATISGRPTGGAGEDPAYTKFRWGTRYIAYGQLHNPDLIPSGKLWTADIRFTERSEAIAHARPLRVIPIITAPATQATASSAANPAAAAPTVAPPTATGTGVVNAAAERVVANPVTATATGAAHPLQFVQADDAPAATATATATALAATAAVTPRPQAATSTGSALQPKPANVEVPQAATGAGAAQTPSVVNAANAYPATATATGAADNLTLNQADTADAQTATATGAAPTASITLTEQPGTGTGTGTATSPSQSISTSPPTATGVAAAQTAKLVVAAPTTTPTGAGQTFAPIEKTATVPAAATATGEALLPSFIKAGQVINQVAEAAGTANPATTRATIPTQSASGTGAAVDTKAATGPVAQTAAATGTGFAPTFANTNRFTPPTATGTGAAFNASASTTETPATATATGTAQTPRTSTTWTPQAATATGAPATALHVIGAGPVTATATAATASQTQRVTVTPIVASATGTAHNVGFGQADALPAATANASAATSAASVAAAPRAQFATAGAAANPGSLNVTPPPPTANSTADTAPATTRIRPVAATGTGTGTAATATKTVTVAAATATGTGAAFNASTTQTDAIEPAPATASGVVEQAVLLQADSAPAGVAAGSATSPQPQARITPAAATATSTATGHDPTLTTVARLATAAATGSAQPARLIVSPAATTAPATAAAADPTPRAAATTSTAAATTTVAGPSVLSLTPPTGTAAASSQAFNPTVGLASVARPETATAAASFPPVEIIIQSLNQTGWATMTVTDQRWTIPDPDASPLTLRRSSHLVEMRPPEDDTPTLVATI